MLFVSKKINERVRVEVGVRACHSLGNKHLYNTYHAAPAHVLALIRQFSIGKPDDLFKGIEELLTSGEVVVSAEEVSTVRRLGEVQRHTR